jgi:integrase
MRVGAALEAILYRLGVPDMVIQRILRHANVSTTTAYYIKTIDNDVRNAMSKLESNIQALDIKWTPGKSELKLI